MRSLTAAVRGLRANPGFSTVAVLTMAVAIAANAAIFSAYDQLVLHPIDVPDPGSLVAVWFNNPKRNVQSWGTSIPRYDELRAGTDVFSSIGASVFDSLTLTGSGDPVQLNVLRVSATFLPTLGVAPELGRNFTPAEDVPNGPAVCLLTHEFWLSQFGGDRATLGRVIDLDGTATQVVGILPPKLSQPYATTQVVVPRIFDHTGLTPAQLDAGATFALPIARLKPGVSSDQAREALAAFSRAYQGRHGGNVDANNVSEARSFVGALVSGVRPTMVTLLAGVACVLLIACANIASLFLSRLVGRSKEIAIRMSLGASRLAVIRQFLIESFAVSGTAGLVAIGLTYLLLAALQTAVASQLPPNTVLALNWRAFLFTAVVTLATTVVTGLLPAIQASRPALVDDLKDGTRGSSGSRGARSRQFLIVAEVTVCIVLLVGAGLLFQTFLALERAPLGFDGTGVASAFVGLPAAGYGTADAQSQFFASVIEHLNAEPGVSDASLAVNPPLGCCLRTPYIVAGQGAPPVGQRQLVNLDIVSPAYFHAIRIPIVGGRLFTADDRASSPGVAIVNQTFAARAFPGQSPIGQALVLGANRRVEIVGMIRDVKDNGASAPTPDELYLPATQLPQPGYQVLARTAGDPAGLQGAIRRAVAAVDPSLAISGFATLDSAVALNTGTQRVAATLTSIFAGLALLLSLSGLYSVLAYLVTQRTLEIGIRLALGATRGHVLSLMMESGLRLVLIGVALGLACATAAGHLIRTLLFGVEALNPGVYAVVAVTFLAVAGLACFVPSWRAARIDPLVAFRLR